MRRIAFPVVILLAIFLWGCSGNQNTTGKTPDKSQPAAEKSGSTNELLPLKVGVLKGTQSFPIAVIQKKGLDKKYNLKMEIVPLAASSAIHTAVNGHQVDAAFSTWAAYAIQKTRGEDPVIIAPVNYYVNSVLVSKDSKISSMKDLKGKKLGTAYPPGNGTSLIFQYAVLKEFGFDPYKENNINQAAAPLLMGLLEKGELDAVYLGEPNVTISLLGGKFKSIWNVRDAYKNINENVPLQLSVVTTEASLSKSEKALKQFAQAYAEAKDILIKDNDVWTDLAKELGITTPEGVKTLRESLQPNYVQDWNKVMIDKEVETGYKMAKSFEAKDFLPDKMPDGLFSFDIYQK